MRHINLTDTIAAISTPIGDAGIGIVRLSGPNAVAIADNIFASKDKHKPSDFKSHTTHYGWIIEKSKVKSQKSKVENPEDFIDEVLLTVMRAPKTYTREDIVEVNCHSGIVPLRKILDLVISQGARLAEPGEFTQRAFLNGRIDLSQAEAVLDIIRAKTDLSLRASISHLKGSLSRKIKKMRKHLLDILSVLEANIGFPQEDDTQGINFKNQEAQLKEISLEIKNLAGSFVHGRILREGFSTVICGSPNVGKSSLLNCLLKMERAIVTPIAGTTRDTIEEIIDIKGIPLKIVDTAGIIEPKDLIERKAISRSLQYLKDADLILLVFDASRKLSSQDLRLMQRLKAKNVIAVINKIDLPMRIDWDKIQSRFKRLVKISALKAKGISDLEEAICQVIWQGELSLGEGVVVNLRHKVCLEKAGVALERALDSWNKKLPLEFICVDLKEAVDSLGEITGEAQFQEDLLDRIFSDFCIGK